MRIKLLLLALAFTVTSCWDVDDYKLDDQVVDPNESLVDTDDESFDFKVPDDFDWENFRVVKSTVTIYNRYEHNVEYGVKIYDGEDVIDAGITKNGIYTSSFAARRGATTLYVEQMDPSGASARVNVVLSGSDLKCDFNSKFAKSPTTISMATRSATSHSAPAAPTIPAEAIEVVEGMTLAENGVYRISTGSVINNVEFDAVSGVQIYIEGEYNISKSSYFNGEQENSIYVLDGGKFTSKNLYSAKPKNLKIVNYGEFTTVGSGADIQIRGSIVNAGTLSVGEGDANLFLLDDSTFENYDEFKAGRLGISKGVVFKNHGDVEISKDVWTQSQPFELFENTGSFLAKGQIQLTGGETVDNYGSIESESAININGVDEVVLNSDSLIKAPNMDFQNSSFISKGDAIIKVETKLTVDGNTTFVGDDSKPSVICGKEGETKIWFNNTSNVTDKWIIDPNPDIWGANWGEDVVLGNPGYVIAATPNNDGGYNADNEVVTPDDLETIDFATIPKVVIFEDRYPNINMDVVLDFNDIVMQWNLRGNKDANDIVKDLYLDVVVKSCGAGRKVGAGVRIHSLASNVMRATIESNEPSKHTFGSYFTPANGVEGDKNGVVVPLFESIQTIFGLEQGDFVNVSNRESERSDYYKFSVKLELDNDITSENLKLENFDFFITTGVNEKGRTEVHTFGNDVSLYANNEISFKNPSAVWALELPKEFLYPTEQKAISVAYPQFKSWIESAGTSNLDWYKHSEEEFVVKNN